MGLVVRMGAPFRLTAYPQDALGAPLTIVGDGTVTIVDIEGVELVTDGVATNPDGESLFYDMTAMGAPDRLTAVWTHGTETFLSSAEVVGALIFTIADARAATMGDEAIYLDAEIISGRADVETEANDIMGVSWVPRMAIETSILHGGGAIEVRWVKVRTVRALSVDGVALTPAQLATLTVVGNRIYGVHGVASGSTIEIIYEHGYESPDSDLRTAMLTRTKIALDASRTDGRGVDPQARFIKAGDEYLRLNRIDAKLTGIDSVDAVYGRRDHSQALQ